MSELGPDQQSPQDDGSMRPPESGAPAVGEAPVAADGHEASGIGTKAPRRALTLIRRIAFWTTLVGSVLALVGLLVVVLVVRHYEAGLPSVAELRAGYDPPQVTRVLARDGTLLANLFTERRTVISISDVPNHAKLAFLAAEDAHFYEHEGLNYFGMLRALVANLRAGHTVQGGSTITQQVVKNVLLDSERSYKRKVRETILARRLEQNLSKDQIFGLYLNHIYFGHGRYGIEEAARYYFGKQTKELGLAEAALLAGLVAAPERFSPRQSLERALERRHYVLNQMRLKGFVTEALYKKANGAPLRLAPAVEYEAELAPEVVSYVQRTLRELVGERARRGGYVITTMIDPALQTAARRAVRENLDRYAKRQKVLPPFAADQRRLWGKAYVGRPRVHKIYVGKVVKTDDRLGTIDVAVGTMVGQVSLHQEERYNPQRLPPSEFTRPGALLRVALLEQPDAREGSPHLRLELGPQSALVAIDVRSREVRALVGSYEALVGGLDRATRARRQPGSAFKPFVYGYALHARRFTPASVLSVVDPSAELGTRDITLRRAVAKSDNLAAQFVLESVGAANVVEWARAMGIESPLAPTPSLALGAYEVSPLEITNAYATFASGGMFAPAQLIKEIRGPDGRLIELPGAPPGRRVLESDEAYLTTSLLQEVVRSGTARRALSLGRPVAGKTGTTNQAKDAWFVGYSPEVVAAVWVGYDDALPLGGGEQGAVTALPGWIDFMKVAHAGRPAAEFPRPASIQVVEVDPATGLLPYPGQEEVVKEEFLAGSVPTESAHPDAGVEAGVDDALDGGTVEAGSGSGEPTPEAGSRGVEGVAGSSGEDEPPPF